MISENLAGMVIRLIQVLFFGGGLFYNRTNMWSDCYYKKEQGWMKYTSVFILSLVVLYIAAVPVMMAFWGF